MTVLARELMTLYSAVSRGQAPALAPPAMRYADYAANQRRRLDEALVGPQLAYWKAQLAGARPSAPLPSPTEPGRGRPPASAAHGCASSSPPPCRAPCASWVGAREPRCS